MEEEIQDQNNGSELSEQLPLDEETVDEPQVQEEGEQEVQAQVEEPQVTARREYHSPYAQRGQQDEVPERYRNLLDADTYRVVRDLARDMAKEELALARTAQVQQRQMAKQLGIPQEIVEEYADDMERLEYVVPEQAKGTRNGAIIAFNAALTERMMQSENPWDEFEKVRSRVPSVPNAPQQQRVQPIPPENRMTSPRGGAVRAATPSSKPDTAASRMMSSWGASDEEIKALREASEMTITSGRR